MLADNETTVRNLAELRSTGVRIALDDFGTGYSSMSHLDRLQIDIVKIDKSFIQTLGGGDDSHSLAAAMVQLAHTLGYETIGEGVENPVQENALRALGCRFAQGYHLGRPLNVECTDLLLRSESALDPRGRDRRQRLNPGSGERERTSAANSTERSAASAPSSGGTGDIVLMMMSVKPSSPKTESCSATLVGIAIGHRPALEAPVAGGDEGIPHLLGLGPVLGDEHVLADRDADRGAAVTGAGLPVERDVAGRRLRREVGVAVPAVTEPGGAVDRLGHPAADPPLRPLGRERVRPGPRRMSQSSLSTASPRNKAWRRGCPPPAGRPSGRCRRPSPRTGRRPRRDPPGQ